MNKRQVAAPQHHWASGPVYRTDLHFAAPNHSDDRGDATAFRKRVSGRRASRGREPNFPLRASQRHPLSEWDFASHGVCVVRTRLPEMAATDTRGKAVEPRHGAWPIYRASGAAAYERRGADNGFTTNSIANERLEGFLELPRRALRHLAEHCFRFAPARPCHTFGVEPSAIVRTQFRLRLLGDW